MPRLGAHVSAADGLENAPANAAELGINTFQFFTRPPQSYKASPLTDKEVDKFLEACQEHGQETWHVHAPYIINLASDDNRVRHTSIGLLKEEIQRSASLNAATLIAHVGSATNVSREQGIEMVIKGLDEILDGYEGPTYFAIETTAGSGNVLGSSFEEIAKMLDGVKHRERLGVCLDTCHIYVAGYDLDTEDSAKAVIDEFDQVIGLEHLKAIHLNDSMPEKGSRKDRHAHLGHGKIGLEGFVAFLSDPRLQNIDFLLETPKDDKRADDIAIARRWFKGEKAEPKDGGQSKLV